MIFRFKNSADMKINILFIILPLVLAACSPALVVSDDVPPPETIILNDDQDKYPLGLQLEILEDPGGDLTIEDITSPEYESQFIPSQEEVPNTGITESAIWVRFNVQNDSLTNNNWLLEVAFPNIHFVDLYTPLVEGEGYSVTQTGNARPPENRDILHPNFVFSMEIPTQVMQTNYMRFKSDTSTVLPILLWKPDAFIVESQKFQVLDILIVGALIGLLIYT